MAIYLFRHGESTGNAGGFFQGHLDTPLTQTGISQAQTAGNWLKSRQVTVTEVYSSSLSRAAETARIISDCIDGPEPVQSTEIAEFHAGEIEGLKPEEMEQKFPGWTTRELGERGDFSAYGGESYDDIQVRLQQFATRFTYAEYRDRDVVVVSHGGAIYQLMKLWCGWPVPRHFFTRIENCTCFCLRLRVVSGHECAELQSMVPLELMG